MPLSLDRITTRRTDDGLLTRSTISSHLRHASVYNMPIPACVNPQKNKLRQTFIPPGAIPVEIGGKVVQPFSINVDSGPRPPGGPSIMEGSGIQTFKRGDDLGLAPGCALRERYLAGTKGGYIQMGVGNKSNAAISSLTNILIPNLCKELQCKVEPKKIVKTLLRAVKGASLSPQTLRTAAHGITKLMIKSAHGKHFKLNTDAKHFGDMRDNLAVSMHSFLQSKGIIGQGGGGKKRLSREDRRRRRAKTKQFLKSFYKGFRMVMKPALKVLAPIAGTALSAIAGPAGMLATPALKTVAELM